MFFPSLPTSIIIGSSFLLIFIIEAIITFFIHLYEVNLSDTYINTTLAQITNITQQNIIINLDSIRYNLLHTSSIHQSLTSRLPLSRYLNLIHYDSYPFRDIIPLFLWAPYLNYTQLSNYTSYIKSSSIPNYQITHLNSTLTGLEPYMEPLEHRYYAPLTFSAPFVPINTSAPTAYGFDLLSNPLTAVYLEDQIWANGDFTISNRSSRLSMVSPQYGVMLGIPSLMADSNNDTDIKDNIIGFNIILIKTQALVLKSLPELDFNHSQILLHIFNVFSNGSQEILHLDPELSNDTIQNNLLYPHNTMFNIKVINRNWKINIYFPETYIDSLRSNQIIIVLISTIVGFFLFDIVLVGIVFSYFSFKARNAAISHRYHIANNMLGYVNHEIRNPLNSIIGLVDLTILQLEALFPYSHRTSIIGLDDESYESAINTDSDNTKEKQEILCMRSNLNTAAKSCMLLRHIVNDILDVRRLEEGKLELSYSVFSLESLFRDITKIMNPKLMEKPHLYFKIHYANKQIRSDKSRLIQLLLNLISNSIKYTINGGIDVYVQDMDDNKIKFIVIDTGIGIPENKKSHIFQPFEQLQDDNPRYGGIGLGLYLCKMLVNNMKGNIGFQSQQGVGSTFWISLNAWESNLENV